MVIRPEDMHPSRIFAPLFMSAEFKETPLGIALRHIDLFAGHILAFFPPPPPPPPPPPFFFI